MPNITFFERTDATSFHLSWDTLTLEELRGFFHSYAVAYQELNTFQCVDIDLSTSQLTTVHEPFIVISDLAPGKEYCVGVAARTSVGAGNYTQLLIPCKCQVYSCLQHYSSPVPSGYINFQSVFCSVHKPPVPSPFLWYS